MAVPRKKISQSRRGTRRSHDAAVARQLSACSHCGDMKPPHTICPSCGYYNGEKVQAVASKEA